MNALIELKNITKTFKLESGSEHKVLQNVNLQIYNDEIVALLGPSGSGKSTLLRIMAGLTEADDGSLLWQNKPLTGSNQELSLVFQSFALFPWETVYNNLALALKPLNLAEGEIKTRVKKAIDLVGLEGFEEAYPRELSGGMKQRVGIARALVMNRPVMLLDEPFSALDILTADTLRTELVKIFLEEKTLTSTMVLVTHNIQEAVYMARRILIMGINPGYIRKEIINDLPYPRNESSPSFQRMVSQIHSQITETLLPDEKVGTPITSTNLINIAKEAPIETLPNIQIVEMIGLMEVISDHHGVVDIFELTHETHKDFGSTVMLLKAAELLDLVTTPKQTVVLTDLGRHFVNGDINVRKRMLHELFSSLRIVQITSNLLRKNENLRLSVETLHERVSEWLPSENSEDIVEALISWGRFAEYFGYNDDTKEVYLDIGQEFNV